MKFALCAVILGLACCSYVDTLWGTRNLDKDPRIAFKSVDLADLAANSDAYINLAVKFDCVLNKKAEDFYVPMYSHFTQERFVCFSAWPTEIEFWKPDAGAKCVKTLFVDKSSSSSSKLVAAPQFSRLTVYGLVVYSYGNSPWVDVHDVSIGGVAASEKAVGAYLKGTTLFAAGKRSEAKNALEEAVNGHLPDSAKAEAALCLAKCCEEAKDFAGAQNAMKIVASITHKSEADKEAERLGALAEQKGVAKEMASEEKKFTEQAVADQLKAKDDQIKQLQKDKADLQSQVDKLKKELSARSDETAKALQKQIDEKDAKIKQLEKDKEDLAKKVASGEANKELQEQLDNARKSNSQMKKQIDKLVKEIIALKEELKKK